MPRGSRNAPRKSLALATREGPELLLTIAHDCGEEKGHQRAPPQPLERSVPVARPEAWRQQWRQRVQRGRRPRDGTPQRNWTIAVAPVRVADRCGERVPHPCIEKACVLSSLSSPRARISGSSLPMAHRMGLALWTDAFETLSSLSVRRRLASPSSPKPPTWWWGGGTAPSTCSFGPSGRHTVRASGTGGRDSDESSFALRSVRGRYLTFVRTHDSARGR